MFLLIFYFGENNFQVKFNLKSTTLTIFQQCINPYEEPPPHSSSFLHLTKFHGAILILNASHVSQPRNPELTFVAFHAVNNFLKMTGGICVNAT